MEPLLRRRGVGTQLLENADALVRDARVATLVTVHSSRAPARAAFEALLRRRGWTAPRELDGRAAWAHRAREEWRPFLARWRRGGYSSTPGDRMTEEDRRELASLADRATRDGARLDAHLVRLRAPRGPARRVTHRRHAGRVRAPGGAHGRRLAHVLRARLVDRDMRRFVDRHLAPFTDWIDARYISERPPDGQDRRQDPRPRARAHGSPGTSTHVKSRGAAPAGARAPVRAPDGVADAHAVSPGAFGSPGQPRVAVSCALSRGPSP